MLTLWVKDAVETYFEESMRAERVDVLVFHTSSVGIKAWTKVENLLQTLMKLIGFAWLNVMSVRTDMPAHWIMLTFGLIRKMRWPEGLPKLVWKLVELTTKAATFEFNGQNEWVATLVGC
ncbi:MAG: hypothetical protein ACTS80_01005 [Candidatus Hodgkinia cicadicola]